MKYATNMGGVWRLSDRSYRRLLRAIANDEEFDLDKLGKLVAEDPTDVTDMDAGEAKSILESLKEK